MVKKHYYPMTIFFKIKKMTLKILINYLHYFSKIFIEIYVNQRTVTPTAILHYFRQGCICLRLGVKFID